jgi:hypothetical protein
MKTKFGTIVVDGRGKLGGHFFSVNVGGSFMGTKANPIIQEERKQLKARERAATLSRGWGSLTENQRIAWNNSVKFFKRSNVFGNIYRPSGFGLYRALNLNLTIAHADTITEPPVPQKIFVLDAVYVSGGYVAGSLVVNWSPVLDSTTSVLIYATRPLSQGKKFDEKQFNFLSYYKTPGAGAYTATNRYINTFGGLPLIGQKIFVKIVPVNTISGERGIQYISSFIQTS